MRQGQLGPPNTDGPDQPIKFQAANYVSSTKTNYVITVNPFTDEITFDPAVYEWETANPGSTEIKFN
ncbi:MAG: hypothetical protein MJZ24_11515 [Paludibacteraceae bacterium]|nr:hypothetical protein [Paludibacteraceae bacterium]